MARRFEPGPDQVIAGGDQLPQQLIWYACVYGHSIPMPFIHMIGRRDGVESLPQAVRIPRVTFQIEA